MHSKWNAMIHIKFDKSEDGKSISLTMNGHAGYSEEGQDIVCSAASILAYTAAQIVRWMHEDGKLQNKPRIRMEPGDIQIVCTPKEDEFPEALHTYSVVQVGCRLLAQTYPEFVSLKMFGES